MSSLSVKDLTSFNFESIKNEDLPRVLASLRNSFYVDEVLNSLLGTSEDRMRDLDKVVTSAVAEGHSLMATEKTSNRVSDFYFHFSLCS